ncbi:MAG TPA: helix-turn-helix domain-containing protein [Gaiellaceae bacterium]|nr:helix-turn-helix domain-containing protein [Gaiellaceae bacterium]
MAPLLGPDAPAVHGPRGKIALVRQLLGMRQLEFARALGVSRESVSHWENLDADGLPRQRVTPKNAAAIAELVSSRLGEAVPASAFSETVPSPMEFLASEVARLATLTEAVIHEQRALRLALEVLVNRLDSRSH